MLHAVDVARGPDAPTRWVFVLHGIFGAGRNWRSVADALVEARPDWGCVLVDLRLHGRSLGASPPHTLEACAADLGPLIETRGPEDLVLLGHSFGGKVALAASLAAPGHLRQVWVIDASPSRLEGVGSARRVLDLVRRLPASFPSRREAVHRLVEEGLEPAVASWLATNLEERRAGWRWRFRPADMDALLESFRETDLWRVVETPPGTAEVHLVRALRSGALGRADLERAARAARRTGRVRVHELDGGHWLNADNPMGLRDLLARLLP
ncbi:MAG: alpha/beta fold hydrolase [Gemmatimonadota bacterium]